MRVIHRQVAASLGPSTEQYKIERRDGQVPAPSGVSHGYVKKHGIDDALIQPYSGQANRQSLEISSRLALGEAHVAYDLVMDTFPICGSQRSMHASAQHNEKRLAHEDTNLTPCASDIALHDAAHCFFRCLSPRVVATAPAASIPAARRR